MIQSCIFLYVQTLFFFGSWSTPSLIQPFYRFEIGDKGCFREAIIATQSNFSRVRQKLQNIFYKHLTNPVGDTLILFQKKRILLLFYILTIPGI